MSFDSREEAAAEVSEFETAMGKLQKLVDESQPFLLSNKIAVDKTAFSNYLEQVFYSLPKEISRAKELMQAKDQYISAAKDIAAQIKAEALETKNQTEELKAQAEAAAAKIRQDAENNASSVIASANVEAERITNEANDKAKQILDQANEEAEKLISENEITERANRHAQETLQDAQHKIDEAYQAMADHFDELFQLAEDSLRQRLIDTQKSRMEIMKQLSADGETEYQ